MRPDKCQDCSASIIQSLKGVKRYCLSCKKDRERNSARNYYGKKGAKDKHLQTKKDLFKEYKNQVLNHYGRFCACCNERNVEFLSIDHIGGWGKEHREAKITYIALYRWIIKNNFPTTIQILCFNCNMSIGFYGYCPHQKGVSL